MSEKPPVALVAAEAPPRARITTYPDHLAKAFAKRTKRPLGDRFGIRNFGVNLTTIEPGGISSYHHAHTRQDVFLEMGDRTPGDEASYPDDDLRAELVDGAWRFTRKDGSPF